MRNINSRNTRKDKLINTLLIVVVILVLVCAALCVTLIFSRSSSTAVSADYESEIGEKDELNEKLQDEKSQALNLAEQLSIAIEDLESQLSALRSEIDSLSSEIVEKQEKIDDLISESVSSNQLEKKVNELENTVSQKNSTISELEASIDAYKSLSNVDIEEQTRIINELITKLMNAPKRVVETNSDIENSSNISASKNAIVALYYEDLTTGYKIEYNSNKIMFSASLIKAPYVYTLLEQVSEYEKNHTGTDGTVAYGGSNDMYNLNRIWTYDSKKMFRKGSGKIQKMNDGTQMTYLELVKYALEYSDNVAFGHLRDVFGYTNFYSVASTLGVTSMASSFNNLSAADAGKFMKAIYNFIESGDEYGKIMKASMLISNHRVMIPAAVSSKQVAHKYGWDIDSYHDMGIVYDEHPYIIVIMTDLDDGNSAANSFITGVVKTVDKIHTNFYK